MNGAMKAMSATSETGVAGGAAGGRLSGPVSPMTGCAGLFKKETMRFFRVAFQTIGAPVLTTLLYLLVFSHILAERVRVFPDAGVGYVEFLAPGLVMMSVLQNAFSNSSSSLIQSKVSGNLQLILMPPISTRAFFIAYVGASLIRGLVVGAGVLLAALLFAPSRAPEEPLWILVFALLGGCMMGALGVVAGLWAERFDQSAMFQNFVIMPLTFLSGVFYSIQSLPEFWNSLSRLNPFFYMIDGFRRGFFGASDVSPHLSLLVTVLVTAATAAWAARMIHVGYKIRS